MYTNKSRIDPSVELLILEMQDGRLYGEVVVKFEGGRVVLMKKTETIKPASDRDIRDAEEQEMTRGPNERRQHQT